MTATHHRLHIFILAATSIGLSQSLSQFNLVNALTPKTTSSSFSKLATTSTTSALHARPGRQRDSNWEDDTKSSRTNSEITDYLPPWRSHIGQEAFSGSQATPGQKNRPFKAFGAATPQDNVSVAPGGMLPPGAQQAVQQVQQAVQQVQQQAVPRGGGGGNAGNNSMAIHNIKWPLIRDPPGVSSEFPLLLTRICVTVLSAVATWYLHLVNGFSPVLASSAMTLLVSTCLDRRLGQAAFCGSFAGMSGGHLAPNLSMALVLGALSSASYELLIHINNFCLGIGGRLGATAFAATALLAKYQGVASVGKKMRRGLWKAGAGPSSVVISMVLFHMIGSVATIFLRECSDDSAAADPVRASSVVGLCGALFMKDPTALLALYGGSFVGMALPSRLMYGNAPGHPKAAQPQTALKLFTSFAGAGAISGLIHAITLHNGYWLGGWGGKAGLCAFAGCWVYRGIGNALDFVGNKAK